MLDKGLRQGGLIGGKSTADSLVTLTFQSKRTLTAPKVISPVGLRNMNKYASEEEYHFSCQSSQESPSGMDRVTVGASE
jgi:hypothetical protein